MAALYAIANAPWYSKSFGSGVQSLARAPHLEHGQQVLVPLGERAKAPRTHKRGDEFADCFAQARGGSNHITDPDMVFIADSERVLFLVSCVLWLLWGLGDRSTLYW